MRYEQIVGGNFEVVFDGDSRWARFSTKLYSQLRSSGLIYGDSAIFARRSTYEKIRGYKPLPLFEDVDFAKRLQKKGQFKHINLPVTISSKRFENSGFLWSFTRWSFLQGLYWLGFPPGILANRFKAIR
jgi:hypothetical protein